MQLVVGTNLISFRPRVTAGSQVDDVTVRGWDPVAKRPSSAGPTAASDDRVRGARRPVELAGAFGGAQHVCVTRPIASQTEADAAAYGPGREPGRRARRGRGRGGRRPAAAGRCRRLGGARRMAVRRPVHPDHARGTSTTSGGYRTYVGVSGRTERSLLRLTGATDRPVALVHGVVVALVTDVDDPDEAGRVKLSFPWLSDDYESWWARVAQLGAGDQRGARVAARGQRRGARRVRARRHPAPVRRRQPLQRRRPAAARRRAGRRLDRGGQAARVRLQGRATGWSSSTTTRKSGVAVVSGDDSLRISLKQTGHHDHDQLGRRRRPSPARSEVKRRSATARSASRPGAR